MRQVSRVLSTYTADVSGVCSALYEMGGMIIMHDASGCNSTYNTHDEPRWYDMPALVFVSGLSELEAVMGDEEKLMRDVEQAARELRPRFVAIAGTPIPMMMGTDFRGLARILERRLGIPVLGFSTNGTHSYVSGAGMALAEAARRFCLREDIGAGRNVTGLPEGRIRDGRDGGEMPSKAEKQLTVNLLGVTPLDFSVTGNVEALREVFAACGYRVNSCWAMGSSWEELIRAGEAQVNVVVSAAGIELAKALQELFQIPWVLGIPAGQALTRAVMDAVDRAARTGENQLPLRTAPEIIPEMLPALRCGQEPAQNRGQGQSRMRNRKLSGLPAEEGTVYIIGEWVWAMSLRYSLVREYGCPHVKVICPLEPGEIFTDRIQTKGRELVPGILEVVNEGSLFLEYEDQIEEQLKDAAAVIADPLYRRILPGDRKVRFLDFPHEGYSGRIYRKDIPVFIGEGWNRWVEAYAGRVGI